MRRFSYEDLSAEFNFAKAPASSMNMFDRENYRVKPKVQASSLESSDEDHPDEANVSPLQHDLERAVRRLQVFTGLFNKKKPRFLIQNWSVVVVKSEDNEESKYHSHV